MMTTNTMYGIQKCGSDNPIMPLDKSEYETVIRALEFTERVYDLDSDRIAVRDETTGFMTELTIRHIIKVY